MSEDIPSPDDHGRVAAEPDEFHASSEELQRFDEGLALGYFRRLEVLRDACPVDIYAVSSLKHPWPYRLQNAAECYPASFWRSPQRILDSAPWTMFSTAGNHEAWDFDTHDPQTERAREHIVLAFHTLGLVEALSPEFWYLENPRGRLRWFFGQPTGTVTYCQYGKDYQKPTDLWGEHPPGFTYRSCPTGGDCHDSNTEDDGYSAIQAMPSDRGERAKVPFALSESILEAVESADDRPDLQQQRLGGYVATDGGVDR